MRIFGGSSLASRSAMRWVIGSTDVLFVEDDADVAVAREGSRGSRCVSGTLSRGRGRTKLPSERVDTGRGRAGVVLLRTDRSACNPYRCILKQRINWRCIEGRVEMDVVRDRETRS